jgi:hypothetical protein
MEYFTPKVTIELSEYERLKDIEYQALDILKGRFKIEDIRTDSFIDPEQKIVKFGIIYFADLEDYFNNLLGITRLVIKKDKGEE